MRMTRTSTENDLYANEKCVESDVESINCCQLNVHKARIRESRSKYHNYPEKRLFHRRSCTDLLCFLLFIACLVGWVYLGYYAVTSTPPGEIFIPTDSNNKRCGLDEEVKTRPYLFHFDLLKCVPPKSTVFQCETPKVCVKECPKENFYLKFHLKSYGISFIRNKMICKDGFSKLNIYDKASAVKAIKNNDCAEWYLESKPVYRRCLYNRIELFEPRLAESYFKNCSGNDTRLTDAHVTVDAVLSRILLIVSDKNTVHQVPRFLCRVPFDSFVNFVKVGYRCLPKSLRNTGDEIRVGFESLGKTMETTIAGVTGRDLLQASKAMSDLYEFGHQVFQDLTVIWPWILAHICVAAIVSFLYIMIMRWISGLLVWLSILSSIGLLLYTSYYAWFKFQAITKETGDPAPSDLQDTLLGLLWKKETWLVFFVLSVLFLVVIIVTLIFLRSRISMAIELIKEGSKAVVCSWSAVIFPVFPWVMQMAAIAYAMLIFAYLMNSGIPVRKVVGMNGTDCECNNSYQEGSYCDEKTFNKYCHTANTKLPCKLAKCVFSEGDTQKQAIYLQLYNLLMVLWSLFFASGFEQIVLASTFATYYWTFNKDNLPVFMVARGVWKVIRYHLGTVSFGSLLLALCNWIRVLIEFLYNYLNKYDNWFVKSVKCCCSCVFWCLNTFLKFLNKNAYIMCAIHGKNFCSSARIAFNLLMRNVLRVIILDRVTNFLFFLGKLMVTTGLGVLAFYFFSNPVPPISDPLGPDNRYQVQYYFVPIFITCTAAYFISSLFFGVYSMAVDTLFLCALEDLETNDGTAEKPYFMSKDLMKILRKKNEIKVT